MLIKNATLITDSETFQSDLLIDGEKITRIEPNISAPGHEILDASGKLLESLLSHSLHPEIRSQV